MIIRYVLFGLWVLYAKMDVRNTEIMRARERTRVDPKFSVDVFAVAAD
jgi:hypothetical protein